MQDTIRSLLHKSLIKLIDFLKENTPEKVTIKNNKEIVNEFQQ